MHQNKKHLFYIGQHPIGPQEDVFIIAEAGVNHNGKLNLALELVDAAKNAGANCVKFQTFQGADLVTSTGKMASYQQKNLGVIKSQKEMLEELVLPDKYYPKIIAHCEKRHILFVSTPHGGFGSVNFLEQFGIRIPAYKIGSGDLTNLPLLTYISSLGKPMIVSTGMGTLTEIEDAVKVIEKTGNRQLVLLHCTSNYPCPLGDVNLKAMQTLIKHFTYPIGYSDHTAVSHVPEYAVLLGASVIEKHLTTNRSLPGPDQVNSLEPDEFKAMVDKIREVEKLPPKKRHKEAQNIPATIVGSPVKRPNLQEIEIAQEMRKSVVFVKNLPKGHVVERIDLDIKRPGKGLAPKHLYEITGKLLTRAVKADTMVYLKDFE